MHAASYSYLNIYIYIYMYVHINIYTYVCRHVYATITMHMNAGPWDLSRVPTPFAAQAAQEPAPALAPMASNGSTARAPSLVCLKA